MFRVHAIDPRPNGSALGSPVAAITYTLGGLRVDHDMSVRGSGVEAPVYAAGADAGNVYEDVYGGGLGWALVSGRRAGAAGAAG